HNVLLSLNEVGGDPRQFGVSPAAFHHANRQRLRQWPNTMLATATHDTKRGEDARTRIDVLSEMPDAWGRRARRWAALNRFLRREVDGTSAPSRNDEYMIYQTLVGAWPAKLVGAPLANSEDLQAFTRRMAGFVVKAVREAKVATSWDNPNLAYENACTVFLERMLDASRSNPFLADFVAFQVEVAHRGVLSSLSQTVLKLTVPGVPD